MYMPVARCSSRLADQLPRLSCASGGSESLGEVARIGVHEAGHGDFEFAATLPEPFALTIVMPMTSPCSSRRTACPSGVPHVLAVVCDRRPR